MIEWAPLGNDNGIISRLPIHLFMISHCMPTIFWLMFADKPIYPIAMMETYWCHWRASHQYLILTLSHNEWSSHNIQYFIYIYSLCKPVVYIHLSRRLHFNVTTITSYLTPNSFFCQVILCVHPTLFSPHIFPWLSHGAQVMDRPSQHPPIDFAARSDASATCSSAAAGRGRGRVGGGPFGDLWWVGDGGN